MQNQKKPTIMGTVIAPDKMLDGLMGTFTIRYVTFLPQYLH